MLCARLDLHKRFSVITAMDVEGKVARQEKAANGQVPGVFQDPVIYIGSSWRSPCTLSRSLDLSKTT